MRTFDDLKVWRRSHALVKEIYEQTRRFPSDERFGLTSQLRRAAVSIAANLAEGCKRSTRADFARHVSIATGSASEVDYLVLLAFELSCLEEQPSQLMRKELAEILRMLTSLRLSLVEAA
jgi:four helix bundle protein